MALECSSFGICSLPGVFCYFCQKYCLDIIFALYTLMKYWCTALHGKTPTTPRNDLQTSEGSEFKNLASQMSIKKLHYLGHLMSKQHIQPLPQKGHSYKI